MAFRARFWASPCDRRICLQHRWVHEGQRGPTYWNPLYLRPRNDADAAWQARAIAKDDRPESLCNRAAAEGANMTERCMCCQPDSMCCSQLSPLQNAQMKSVVSGPPNSDTLLHALSQYQLVKLPQ